MDNKKILRNWAKGFGKLREDTSHALVQKFIENGSCEEATIGIFAYDKNVIPYLNNGIKFENGIYVEEVTKNSSAENSGIKKGDIITKIDGKEINKMNELKEYIYTKNPGDEINLTILRNKNTIETKVTLTKK